MLTMIKSLSKVLLVTHFLVTLEGADGLQNVELEASRWVRKGEDVLLECNYDLGSDILYAVKWYRGSEEFYRFLPKETPPKQTFPVSGIVVNLNQSNDHVVSLENISFAFGGTFRCVISVEATFQTLDHAKDIDVISIDYNSPKLYVDKMNYHLGDVGVANCGIEKTFPVPNITWFINGKVINGISIQTRVEPDNVSSSTVSAVASVSPTGNVSKGIYSPQITSIFSTLSFPISSYNPITIKCRGELYSIYNETSSILISVKVPQFDTVRGSPPQSNGQYVKPEGHVSGGISTSVNGPVITTLKIMMLMVIIQLSHITP